MSTAANFEKGWESLVAVNSVEIEFEDLDNTRTLRSEVVR